MFTKNFEEISSKDVGIAGGKGASLGEMISAGIPVPPGFVVLTDAFEKFLTETDLKQEITSELNKVEQSKMHTVEYASGRIQNLILSAKMPNDIAMHISEQFGRLDAKLVAVRSSATAEDSASAAWAGQLDSFLNTTEESLLENVKKCWASLFTPRAIFYRFEKGLEESHVSVAVVVQKMIQSEKSGIAFSVHPVTEDRNQIIIEAGFGLGEAIVSGSITPDSYVVGKDGIKNYELGIKNEETRNNEAIIDVNVSVQTKALYGKDGGGNEWKELGEEGEKQVLNDGEILELSELIIQIENHYGFPCDIEWAQEGGKFYITQSRPITTLMKGNDKKITLTNNQTREHSFFYASVWSESNLYDYSNYGFSNAKNLIFIRDGASNRLKVYYDLVEINEIYSEISNIIEQDDNLFIRAENDLNEFTEELLKYVNDEKNVDDLDGLKDFHDMWRKWWTPMATIFVIPSIETISLEIRNKALSIRKRIEKYSDEFDKIYVNFFIKKFPEYKTIANVISAEEVFLLKGGELSEKKLHEIEKRLDGGGIINYKFFSRDQIEKELTAKNLVLEKIEPDYKVGEIKGEIANKGCVSGKVRVVKFKSEVKEFQEGDILVTHMTSPDYIPAVKKATAIVTDEGGVTCHAAIVSREFNIPCIIGTKIATQVLHNGDLVEVDADNGVVRILENEKETAREGKDSFIKYMERDYTLRDLSIATWSLLNPGFLKEIYYTEAFYCMKSGLVSSYVLQKDVERINRDLSLAIQDAGYIDNAIREGVRTMSLVDNISDRKITKNITKTSALELLARAEKNWNEFGIFFEFTHALGRINTNLSKKQLDELGKFHNERKVVFLKFFQFLENLCLNATENDSNLVIKNLSYLTISEIKRYFSSELSVDEVNILQKNRLSGYVYRVKSLEKEGKIVTNFESKYVKELISRIKYVEANDLKGISVSSGVIKGEAKIISINDSLENLKNLANKIIVTNMTTPTMDVFLKKVGGIVTEEGGILCHAAILAREINIPTITLVKDATKILKDGDLVEVDADNGVVRVLDKEDKKGDSSMPLRHINKDILQREVEDFKGNKFDLFIRRRVPYFMDLYRIASYEVKERWGLDVFFFEAGHKQVKNVWIDQKFHKDAARLWEKKMGEDPEFIDSVVKELENIGKMSVELAKSVSDIDVKSLKSKELAELVTRHKDYWVKYYSIGFLWFAVDPIVGKLKKEIKKNWQGTKGELEDFFSVAFSPSSFPASSREQRELLELKNLSPEEMEIAIKMHHEKYAHLSMRDIDDEPFDISYFKDRLAIFNQKDEYEKAKKEFDRADQELKKATELISHAKLSEELKKRITFCRDVAYLRTEVIEEWSKVNLAYRDVFLEISKRFDLEMDEVLHMLYKEIVESLKQEKLVLNKKEIIDCTKNGYAFFIAPNSSFFVTGDEVDKLQALIVPKDESTENIKEIKGVSAFEGKATGKVRVILDRREVDLLERGEVLVTAMTMPDFVPAMRISSAIITNEGGILCHAAIMSRELGTPCIIGTKIATQVLKDGDLVEVDAERGVVKILERAETRNNHKNSNNEIDEAKPRRMTGADNGVVRILERAEKDEDATENVIEQKAKDFNILYDQTQYSCFYWMDSWVSQETYDAMEKISGYKPEKWLLYGQAKPESFFFGAYSKETLKKEAEQGLRNLKDKKFIKDFESEIPRMYDAARKLIENYRENFKDKEIGLIKSNPKKIVNLLLDFWKVNGAVTKYYFLTQPQRYYEVEKVINKFLPNKELELLMENGREISPTVYLRYQILLLAKKIKESGLNVESYREENSDFYKKIEKRIIEIGFLNKSVFGGKHIGLEEMKDEIEIAMRDWNNQKEELLQLDKQKSKIRKREAIVKKNNGIEIYELAEITGQMLLSRITIHTYLLAVSGYLDDLVNNIGKVYGLDKMDLDAYALRDLINLAQNGQKLSKEELTRRHKAYLIKFSNGERKELFGEEALKEMADILRFRKDEIAESTELKGTVASSPNGDSELRGRVVVLTTAIGAEDKLAKEFNEGDFLIATQTHPNLVPMMKKAGAVIADEGGLTCHAAIVSRELGKPCIIGTRIGSKIFKTGDQVVINMKTGMVKKT